MKVVEEMRVLAKGQAIRSLELVRQAEDRAKETGGDTEKILGLMIMARLEAAATVKVQGRILAEAYLDARERVVAVGNSIELSKGIQIHEVISRLRALADNIHRSAIKAQEAEG